MLAAQQYPTDCRVVISVEYNFREFHIFWCIREIFNHHEIFCLVQFDLVVGSVHEI